MVPIKRYIEKEEIEEGGDKAAMKRKSARYYIENGRLYRRGFSEPSLQCVPEDEMSYILREAHEGRCGAQQEAIIPIEIGVTTDRVEKGESMNEEENQEALRVNLDLIEEERDIATLQFTGYKEKQKKSNDPILRAETEDSSFSNRYDAAAAVRGKFSCVSDREAMNFVYTYGPRALHDVVAQDLRTLYCHSFYCEFSNKVEEYDGVTYANNAKLVQDAREVLAIAKEMKADLACRQC
ncbi:gag-pol polyprotein [Senna tora]|uniref:Gag-pol polyprotein n=1 Tax=Senna tora TaxID=362788 RepID=A0A834TIL1_9FABA|nr:gag-pol polyprotein [Senna tora]